MHEPSSSPASRLTFSPWFPYVVAACLMVIGVTEAAEIFHLSAAKRALAAQMAVTTAEAEHLRSSLALEDLQVRLLEARDPAYAAASVVVAWDAHQHHGAVSLHNLAAAPAGHAYQLWVLDPTAPAPISAGVVTGGRSFDSPTVSAPKPGFALSLENAGGSATLTGEILFAVAPED
jgi:anti-sigma-K factor RskA